MSSSAAMKPTGEFSHRTKGLIRLTMACNERCPFCNVPMEDYRQNMSPTDEALRVQLETFVLSGEATLTISGGEPTLQRKRLLWLIRAARERSIPFIDLQTNAILIDEAYAAELAAAGLTSAFVSLLSHVEAHHDKLSGYTGAFPLCMRGIDQLLEVGVRVTLNPVTAFETQELLPQYVDFVARRFPEIRTISVSAVQPHGRGAHDLDLLPDYAVLGPAIREARRRAAVHGIELVNPYCGLPPCVGWADGLSHCVEAEEARLGVDAGPNLDNSGNKSYGPPCTFCAFRSLCGGAWHAYWKHRGGSGLRAPATVVPPWFAEADAAPHQRVCAAVGGIDLDAPPTLDRDRPSRWLWTDRLPRNDASRLLELGFTDLALDGEARDFAEVSDQVLALRELSGLLRGRPAQRRPRIFLGLRMKKSTWTEALRATALATALNVDGIWILTRDSRREAFLEAVRAKYPHTLLTVPEPGRPVRTLADFGR